jgi:hypothetical protein
MNMPDIETLKSLKERRMYLLRKLKYNSECDTGRKLYLTEEIRAVEKAINFITWIINSASNNTVRETVEAYRQEKSNSEEETETEEDNETEEINYGMFGETFTRNRRLQIILSERRGVNYIQMESHKRKSYMEPWERTGTIKMTLDKMERILKKAYKKINETGR